MTNSTSPRASKTSTAGPATNPLPNNNTLFRLCGRLVVGVVAVVSGDWVLRQASTLGASHE